MGCAVTHFSLFSGIGGLDIAAEWAGFKTIGQCEYADYPYRVLCKHWPDVPKWRDIHDVTAKSFREQTGIEQPTVISGGFPCQPFSAVGQRRGEADDRYLWGEMVRVISELKPRWVVGENVVGILTMDFDKVLLELESAGYRAETVIIPACAVNAFHRRARVFIVANNGSELRQALEFYPDTRNSSAFEHPSEWEQFHVESRGNNNIVFRQEDESMLCRNDDGLSQKLDADRVKALGNAVVPQQAYPIFKAIAEIEGMTASL